MSFKGVSALKEWMVLEDSSSSDYEVPERNEDESLFAFLIDLGVSVLMESKNRIKLRRCRYKRGSFGW